jgi:hypothetical protein
MKKQFKTSLDVKQVVYSYLLAHPQEEQNMVQEGAMVVGLHHY